VDRIAQRHPEKNAIPTATSKEICGDSSFDLSMLFDQGEIDRNGVVYRPVVALTDDDDKAPALMSPDAPGEFHGYAFGTTDEVFDSDRIQGNAEQVPRGACIPT
jgi:hypothetical protein